MPDARRTRCQRCRRHRNECGGISWRGLCLECSTTAVEENCDGLHYKQGYPLERWRRAMAACVGGVLLEDVKRQ